MKNRTILQGDVLEKLKEIPDGVDGQLGLEPDFSNHLKSTRFVKNNFKSGGYDA